LAGLDRLADGGGHGEDAGIAAGDERHPGAAAGVIERRAGTGELFTVVGSVAALVGAERHAIEIRPVAVDRLRLGERGLRLAGQEARVARAEPDDGEASAHGAGLRAGTSTTAKYGALSPVATASGIRRASGMVPRST